MSNSPLEKRINRRVKQGFCDVKVKELDKALKLIAARAVDVARLISETSRLEATVAAFKRAAKGWHINGTRYP